MGLFVTRHYPEHKYTDFEQEIEKVSDIYKKTLSNMDQVLIGQNDVKKIITSCLLCDTNSRILLSGSTGSGKTTVTNFLASSFNAHRISVTSDMIPSDIQGQLIKNPDMNFLHIDEFNRASGRVQSTFIELFAEKQISIDGKPYKFNDFYVFATQNSADVAGIFNVPEAVYDRFDVYVPFGYLTTSEKKELLFSDFEPAKESNISYEDILTTKSAVDNFRINPKDQDMIMEIFDIIDSIECNERQLFAGSNIRAHKFALKLAKLMALSKGRNHILPDDIANFINYLYMHRIDQNIARIGEEKVIDRFDVAKDKILRLKKYSLK